MLRDDYNLGVPVVGGIRARTRQNPAYLAHSDGFALTFAFLHTVTVRSLKISYNHSIQARFAPSSVHEIL